MEPQSDIVTLSFCDKCSALRLREVKDQLQKLFSEKSTVRPYECGICNKDTSPEPSHAIPPSRYWNADTSQNMVSSNHGIIQEGRYTNEPIGDDTQSYKLGDIAIKASKEEDEDGSSGSDIGDDDAMDVDEVASSETKSKICSQPRAHVDQEASEEVESKIESQPPAHVDQEAGEDVKSKIESQPPAYVDQEAGEDVKFKIAHRKVTRLSTGAMKAKQYMTKVREIDDDEDFIPKDDGDDDDDYNEYNDNDSDDSLDNIARASKTDKPQDTHIKSTPKRHGLEGINPEILALTTPSDDPKRPFKCKLCDKKYFPYLATFQQHIASHTGREPMEKPYKCDVCGNDFKKLAKLTSHSLFHHTKKCEIYKCSVRWCKFTYRNKRDFKCHLETHKGAKPHKCKTCGLGFSTKGRLTIHVTIHSEDPSFACEYCSRTFTHHRLLKEHIINHTQEHSFNCEHCDFTCGRFYMLKIHVKRNHTNRGTLVCDRCHQVFKYPIFLDKHVKLNNCKPRQPRIERHSSVAEEYDDIDISEITKWLDPRLLPMMDRPRSSNSPFKCKQCPTVREFQNAYPFLLHMKNTHSEDVVKKPFLCDQCDSGFVRFSGLQKHIMTHSDIRSHTCPECNKTFKTKQTLRCHGKSHREKQHMCSICGTLFRDSNKLKSHVARIHLRLRPHKCVHCDKSFSDKARKLLHIKCVHDDSRPWICETCGRRFKVKEALTRHSSIHSDKKPYACEFCDHRCSRRQYLRQHIRIHTGEKPHHCDICGSKFAARTSLVLHKKKHHSDVESAPPPVSDEVAAACTDLVTNI